MKKTLLTLVIALFGYGAYAQTNTYPSSGNVGIGTLSPSAALQIGDFNAGSGNSLLVIPGTYNFEQVRLGQIGNGNAALEFVNHTSVSPSYGIKFLVDVDGGAPGLQLQYAPSTTSYSSLSYTTGLYMNLSGNVGIGTTSPANKLQIGSVGSTGYAGNAIAIGDGTNVVALHYGSTGYLVANGNLALGGNTNYTNQLFLSSGGNVGIGTASPNTPLHIYAGTANLITTALRLQGGEGGTSSGSSLLFSSSYSGRTIRQPGSERLRQDGEQIINLLSLFTPTQVQTELLRLPKR